MIDVIRQMLSYPFLSRALIVGILVALCAALLGVNLVLKRYSMIGTGCPRGLRALASPRRWAPRPWACGAGGDFGGVLLLRLGERSKIKGDAAIALISTGLWPWA
jgi:zinc transport system permease protein